MKNKGENKNFLTETSGTIAKRGYLGHNSDKQTIYCKHGWRLNQYFEPTTYYLTFDNKFASYNYKIATFSMYFCQTCFCLSDSRGNKMSIFSKAALCY